MSRSYLPFVAMLLVSAPAVAQVLTCSEAGSGDCHFVHYHVQSWDDRARRTTELYGVNRFSTIEACEAERTRRMAVEKQAVTYVLQRAPRARVQESTFGPCHCDMTSDPANRYFLPDERRFEQMHRQRDITLQLLEEAYDKGLATDSQISQGLASRPTSFAESLWPNVAEVPPDSPDRFLEPTPPEPKATHITAAQVNQLDTSDYQLVEVGFGEEVPLETVFIDAEPTGIDPSAAFVNAEAAEIQGYVPEVLGLPEGTDKEQLLQLIQQRGQLLSSLSRLVQTAGPSSRLGLAISGAATPEDRIALIERLFGPEVGESWTPVTATELLVDLPDAVATDPAAVLRDQGNRFSPEVRKLALYTFLMRTATLTQNQEIWITGLIDTMLAGQ